MPTQMRRLRVIAMPGVSISLRGTAGSTAPLAVGILSTVSMQVHKMIVMMVDRLSHAEFIQALAQDRREAITKQLLKGYVKRKTQIFIVPRKIMWIHTQGLFGSTKLLKKLQFILIQLALPIL